MRVDLVMWAKNGELFLPRVLKRIEEVIPHESVAKKIFVDDKSRDRSREIARDFNWEVYDNPTGFITGGSNEALKHVTQEFFVAVEQDVMLARNWWDRIPQYMDDTSVAVAQGWRIVTLPLVRFFELESLADKKNALGLGRQSRFPEFFSFDNNIFRTKVVRALGGFPRSEPLWVDWSFMRELERSTSYRWIVDTDVLSDHIRLGLKDYFNHVNLFMTLYPYRRIDTDDVGFLSMARLTATSPLRGLQLALKCRCPQFSVIYPYLRLMYFHAYLLRRRMFGMQRIAKPLPPLRT